MAGPNTNPNIPEYYIEEQSWGKTMYDIVPGTHVTFRTERQQVDILTNPTFGRMLFLDGVLQSATADEKVYHKTMVDFAGPSPVDEPKILLLGGAEGALAREVFAAYPQCSNVTMVDWDEALVANCKDEEHWNEQAFRDPRLHLLFEDVFGFLKQKQTHPTEFYDIVFVDLLDLHSLDDILKMQHLILLLQKVLSSQKASKIVLNAGQSKYTAELLADGLGCVKGVFVPSFQEMTYFVRI
jgi:spermidine synthase